MRGGLAAALALIASLPLGACPTSFEVVLPTTPTTPADAGTPSGGDPFECGAPPAVPFPPPEDESGVNFVGDGTRDSCTGPSLQRGLDRGGYVRFRCGTGLAEITPTEPLVIRTAGTVVDGEGRVTVSGANASRLFDVAPGVEVAVLRDLSLSRGSADAGGAVRVATGSRLWLDQVVLTSNVATGATAPGTPPSAGGGAVHVVVGGELVAVNTNFLNNGSSFGGGIWTEGRTGLHATRFRSNLAVDGIRSGGAIAVSSGELVLCDSELEDNRAGQGGAIFADTATVTVSTTSFVSNPALGGDPRLGSVGGAMALRATDASVERSTFDGNLSIQGGGAVDAVRGTTRWENVTFVDNNASGGAGGAMRFDGGRHTLVHGTMLDNRAREAGTAVAGTGEIEVSGSLLSGTDPVCGATYAGVGVLQTGMTPCVAEAALVASLELGAERSTCGRTDVFTPPASSPAVDGGAPGTCPAGDQCGNPRGDGPCDLGAIER